MPRRLKVVDPEGQEITFDWDDPSDPTDEEIDEIFSEAKKIAPAVKINKGKTTGGMGTGPFNEPSKPAVPFTSFASMAPAPKPKRYASPFKVLDPGVSIEPSQATESTRVNDMGPGAMTPIESAEDIGKIDYGAVGERLAGDVTERREAKEKALAKGEEILSKQQASPFKTPEEFASEDVGRDRPQMVPGQNALADTYKALTTPFQILAGALEGKSYKQKIGERYLATQEILQNATELDLLKARKEKGETLTADEEQKLTAAPKFWESAGSAVRFIIENPADFAKTLALDFVENAPLYVGGEGAARAGTKLAEKGFAAGRYAAGAKKIESFEKGAMKSASKLEDVEQVRKAEQIKRHMERLKTLYERNQAPGVGRAEEALTGASKAKQLSRIAVEEGAGNVAAGAIVEGQRGNEYSTEAAIRDATIGAIMASPAVAKLKSGGILTKQEFAEIARVTNRADIHEHPAIQELLPVIKDLAKNPEYKGEYALITKQRKIVPREQAIKSYGQEYIDQEFPDGTPIEAAGQARGDGLKPGQARLYNRARASDAVEEAAHIAEAAIPQGPLRDALKAWKDDVRAKNPDTPLPNDDELFAQAFSAKAIPEADYPDAIKNLEIPQELYDEFNRGVGIGGVKPREMAAAKVETPVQPEVAPQIAEKPQSIAPPEGFTFAKAALDAEIADRARAYGVDPSHQKAQADARDIVFDELETGLLGNKQFKKDRENPEIGKGHVAYDLGNFKEFNDKYGHIEGGDKVLKVFGEILGKLTDSHGGRSYRPHGDEFNGIHPDETTALQIAKSAKEIAENTKITFFDADGNKTGEVAGFIVDYSHGPDFKSADAALKSAKADAKKSRPVYRRSPDDRRSPGDIPGPDEGKGSGTDGVSTPGPDALPDEAGVSATQKLPSFSKFQLAARYLRAISRKPVSSEQISRFVMDLGKDPVPEIPKRASPGSIAARAEVTRHSETTRMLLEIGDESLETTQVKASELPEKFSIAGVELRKMKAKDPTIVKYKDKDDGEYVFNPDDMVHTGGDIELGRTPEPVGAPIGTMPGDEDIPFSLKPASEAGVPDKAGQNKKEIARARAAWEKQKTDSPYFKRWFGKSKVVDESGKPLVVYHGGESGIEAFDPSKINSRNEGPGFYFTTDKSVAKGYDKGSVYETFLKIEKPINYNLPAFKASTIQKFLKRAVELEAALDDAEIADGFLSNYGDIRSEGFNSVFREAVDSFSGDEKAVDQISGMYSAGMRLEIIAKALKETTGYDGFVSDGFSGAGKGGGKIYIPISPEQIKSATGNRGTFDPESPNITYSLKPVTPPARRAKERETIWYSHLGKTIESKMPNSADPQTIRGIMKGAGVKEDEIKWTGIDEFLEGKDKVSKADLTKHLEQNQVQVQEVVKGAGTEEDVWRLRYKDGSATNVGQGYPTREMAEAEIKAIGAEDRMEAELAPRVEESKTKFSNYQTPGGPLSRDTEILTSTGWLRMDAVRVGDTVLTRKDIGGVLEWQHVEAIPSVFASSLFHFFNQSINMMVTKDHQMVVKRRRRISAEIIRVPAERLWSMSECVAPLTGDWRGGKSDKIFGLDAGDAAEFFGWYLAEGSYKHRNGHKNTIQIAQCDKINPAKCARIKALCDRLGFKSKYYGDAFGVGIRSMPPGFKDLLHAQPTSEGKFIPPFFFQMNKTVLERLLAGLMLGDGCVTPAKGRRVAHSFYFTKSVRLAGDVQAVILLTGKHGRVRRRKTGLYAVSIADRQWASIDDAKHAIVPYNDIAFCVTVRNHAIYVRRGGVAGFTGNSNYRELLLTLPEKLHPLDSERRSLLKIANEYPPNPQREKALIRLGEIQKLAPANKLSGLSDKTTKFYSSHFDEPNILAHVRFNDRTVDGKKVLFLEEVQSDWGQSLRKSAPLREVMKPDNISNVFDNTLGTHEFPGPALNEMDASMLATTHHDQISGAIISLLPVNMVNNLKGGETAAKNFFRNPSVILKSMAPDARSEWLTAIVNASRTVETSFRAKLANAIKTGKDVEILPAFNASDLSAREAIGLLAPHTIYGSADIGAKSIKTALPASQAEFLNSKLSTGVGTDAVNRGAASFKGEDGAASVAEALEWHNKILRDKNKSTKNFSERQEPPMPFEKTWHEMALRRMLRWASENGYDRLAWTTGEMQAGRYDLSKQIDALSVTPIQDQSGLAYEVRAYRGPIHENDRLVDKVVRDEKELAETIGKDLAERAIRESENKKRVEYSGLDLKVGGEGMKGFYDKMIPQYLDKYGKRWGAKVEPVEIPVGGDEKAMREAERSGDSRRIADALGKQESVQSILITESMRKSVMEEGQPLFSLKSPLGKPMVERKVEALRKSEEGYGQAYSNLVREKEETWASLEDDARKIAETWNWDDFTKTTKGRQLNASEVMAIGARIKDADVREVDALTDAAAARAAGDKKGADIADAKAAGIQLEKVALLQAGINNATQSARALAVHSKWMEAVGKNADTVFLLKAIKELGVKDEDALKLLRIFKDDPKNFGAAVHGYLKFGAVDKIMEYWKAGLLSGVPTHVANTAGNTIEAGILNAETFISGGMDKILGLFQKGGERQRYMGEGLRETLGLAKGFVPAAQKFISGLAPIAKLEGREFNLENKFERQAGAIKGKKGELIRTPFKFLELEDDYFKTLGRYADIQKLAYRKARKEGLSEGKLKAREGEIVAEFMKAPEKYPEIAQEVAKSGKVRTYQESSDAKPYKNSFATLADHIAHAKNSQSQGVKLLSNIIFPFSKTPANIFDRAIERSPIGYIHSAKVLNDWGKAAKAYETKAKVAEQNPGNIGYQQAAKAARTEMNRLRGVASDQLARATVGTVALSGIGLLAAQGIITGSGPSDPAKRKLLENELGWAPYAVKIGDKYLPLQRIIGAMGPSIGTIADIFEAAHAGDEKGAGKSLEASLKNITDQSYLQGLMEFASAVQDPKRYAKTYAMNLGTSMVPFSSLTRSVARAADKTQRDVKGEGFIDEFSNRLQSNIPFLSRKLPEKYGVTGNVQERKGTAAERLLSPAAVSKDNPEAVVEKALLELDYKIPVLERKIKTNLSPDEAAKDYQLTDEEFDVLLQARKEATAELRTEIDSPAWQEMDVDERSRTAEDIYRSILKGAKEEVKDMIRTRLGL